MNIQISYTFCWKDELDFIMIKIKCSKPILKEVISEKLKFTKVV